jgi:hypothetical protein
MSDREDWADAEDVYDGECDHCGERRPVRYDVDPRATEFSPGEDNEKTQWCRDCWGIAAADI